jgi:hypothetical protein
MLKTVKEHPYPWYSGSPETVCELQTNLNSNRSGATINQENQPLKQIKKDGINSTLFYKLNKGSS